MKPLDERMRETAKTGLRPPALWNDIRRWADEVTSLLIANEELTKQNQELCDQLNSQYWITARESSDALPF